MFDIGFFELCVIGVVALLVLGPERLPRAARTAGMWMGRAKKMVAQVKRDIDDELRQEDLQELKEFREAKETLSQTRESLSSFKEDLNKSVDSDTGKDKPQTNDKAKAKAKTKAKAKAKDAKDDTKSSPAEASPGSEP